MTGDRKFKLHHGQVGAAITVRVQPRSKRNQIREILEDGTIDICLSAPNTDQDINVSLIEFLSQILGNKKGDIEIIAGQQGLDKLVTILNLDADTVQKMIMKTKK